MNDKNIISKLMKLNNENEILKLENKKNDIFKKNIYNYSTEYNRKKVKEYKNIDNKIKLLKTKIMCIMGKSGVGKSTLIKELMKNDCFHYVKSFTTREERKNDPNDKETHIFITDEKFKKDLEDDKIIALYISPLGYKSYTSIESFDVEKINLYAIDCHAFNELSQKTNNIYGVYLDLDETVRLSRKEKRDIYKDNDKEDHLSKKHLKGENYIILDINNKAPKEISDLICCK